MTDLRDARLKQALDHAPDAHMAPDARTRAAIRAMAGQAAEPAPLVPWWRRLTGSSSSPSSRMPWNAAFATVLLASLVTLIWRDEEIPGAKSGDAPMASAPPASPPKADATQALPVQAPPAPPAPAKKAEAARAESQGKSATTAPDAAQRERRAPAQADAPAATPAMPAPAPAPATRDDDQRRKDRAAVIAQPSTAAPPAAPAAPQAQAAPTAPPAPPAPAPAMEAAPRPAPAPPPAIARAAPPAPAAPAAAMPSRQRESQAMPESARAAGAVGGSAAANAARQGFAAFDDAALQGWTQARITFQGRTNLVSRAQAESLAAQIRELALAVTGRNGSLGPVVLQIELLEGGVVTGTLAVGETTARWTQLRVGFEQGSGSGIDAARVRQLLAEAERLAPR